MTRFKTLTAIVLFTAMAAPAVADIVKEVDTDMVLKRTRIVKLDESILHPIEKEIPIPVPGCGYCPHVLQEQLVLPQGK